MEFSRHSVRPSPSGMLTCSSTRLKNWIGFRVGGLSGRHCRKGKFCMSQSDARYEAKRWWLTAQDDFEAAETMHQAGKYSHACFLSQQSAEKAMKALWFATDSDPWVHSVQKLVMQFPQQDRLHNIQNWITQAAYLGKFYIPTRYPNGLPDLIPSQVYNEQDSTQAIERAEFFLEESRRLLEVE